MVTVERPHDPEAANRLTIGIDPPGAWAVWARHGLVDAYEVTETEVTNMRMGMIRHVGTKEAKRDRVVRSLAAKKLHERLKKLRVDYMEKRTLYVGAVERPYGTNRDFDGSMASILSVVASTGWWLRETERWCLYTWNPLPGTWRKPLGISSSSRESSKREATSLMDWMCREQGRPLLRGPLGGILENATDAACIAASAWVRHGLMHENDEDLAWRWYKKTGAYKFLPKAKEGETLFDIRKWQDHRGFHIDEEGW